jgi:hypothetical protein
VTRLLSVRVVTRLLSVRVVTRLPGVLLAHRIGSRRCGVAYSVPPP